MARTTSFAWRGLLGAAVTFLSAVNSLSLGQVFSVDPAAPSFPPASAANLYLPGPALYAPASAIGLLAGDDISGFSWGFDKVGGPPLSFSTDWSAISSGGPPGGNALCSQAGGACGPPLPACPPEVAGDIYLTFGGGMNSLLFDGDGAPPGPSLGLFECGPPAAGSQDNVDAFDDLVAPLLASGRPAWRAYFTLAPGAPTLGGANPLLPGGAGPADILVFDSAYGSLSVFFSAAGLGLSAADVIHDFAFNVLTSDLIFALAPGSPSLGTLPGCPCTAGDFIRSAGPVCGVSPCLGGGLSHAAAGLAAVDRVDAVDQPGSPPSFVLPVVASKTYTVDKSSPVLKAITVTPPGRPGSAADLLTQNPRIPTAAPIVAFPAESLGLTPADQIAGLSFGEDPTFRAALPYAVDFSVNRLAVGAAGSGVAIEVGAPTGREASADIFSTYLPVGTPPFFIGTNSQSWDGNGTTAPNLQLRDVPLDLARNDDLVALAGPPQLLDPDRDGVRDRPVFFSLAPGSPTLGLIGATPNDILMCPPPSCPLPAIFIPGAAMGLLPGDQLEDFCLDQFTGQVNFTLQPGAPTLGILGATPGSILRPGPGLIYSSSALGLAAGDNLDALHCTIPAEVCVLIAPGPDPTIKVSKRPCPPPAPAGTYDVIEGDVREIRSDAAGLEVGHVFCRVNELGFDKTALTGGMDPYEALFILVRNGAGVQADYGVSSSGNPRFPAEGGCP